MMATRSLNDYENFIRSIERFCEEKGIHKTSRLSQAEVQHAVAASVAKVKSCVILINVLAK